jgi:hypothetical protein
MDNMAPLLTLAGLLSSFLVYSAAFAAPSAPPSRQYYIQVLEKEVRKEKTSTVTAENLPEPGSAKAGTAGAADGGSASSTEAASTPTPRPRTRRVSAPDAASSRTKINTTDDGVDTLSFP